jgi:hypothetical protein
MGSTSTSCACKEKKNFLFTNVSKSLKKGRLQTYFDGQYESFNTEFIAHNILVKGISMLVQKYEVVFRLPFSSRIPLIRHS